MVAAVAGQPARWPRECGAGRAPEPRIRPVRADSLSSSSLRAVGDTIPGHCAGSGNLAPSCHSVEPGRARLCFRLYCFLMTPDVSLTVVVKGFQGMAAIKQRPPKPGNTGSRVSGFIVSRQKSAPSRVAEFAEHCGPLAPDRNTAARPRILACLDRRGRWISYPCTRQERGGSMTNGLDLETLANVGEFVSAVAVVVSLIYLAFQVRQNTASLRTESHARRPSARASPATWKSSCRRDRPTPAPPDAGSRSSTEKLLTRRLRGPTTRKGSGAPPS